MTATPLSIARCEDQLWPTLTPAQIARIEKRGQRRLVRPGDVLLEAGQAEFPFFAVFDGELEVVRPSCEGEQLVATYRKGAFSGELNMLVGRRPVATIRATCPK